MSQRVAIEGVCTDGGGPIAAVVEPRARDLGGFTVARILPAVGRRHIGPFVFLDRMGGADVTFAAGQGLDVRPHPHIGLATVTYLFEGAIVHRDSLGSNVTIAPGDINWMTAGRGIVHSERTAPEERKRGGPIHGLQLWVALPDEREELEPAFDHYAAATLPQVTEPGVTVRVLAGSAFGLTSPVRTQSPTLYVDVALAPGATVEIPAEHDERGVLVIAGEARCGDSVLVPGPLYVLEPRHALALRSDVATRLVVLGGAHVGERHIWWNFVSSSRERMEQAKADWRTGRFPKVPGDEVEFIPLPE